MNKPNPDIVVVKVLDEYTVVINKGSDDGIKPDYRFLIYSIDEQPLIDPVTKKDLGQLEIVKGKASVKHLQDTMCTIESSEYEKPTKTIKKTRNPFASPFNSSIIEETSGEREQLPFNNVTEGDYVKII